MNVKVKVTVHSCMHGAWTTDSCLKTKTIFSEIISEKVEHLLKKKSISTMTSDNAVPPSVSWAQRSACVFLTFNVECEKPDIKIESNSVTFKGVCAPDKKLHEVHIPLYAEIDPGKSTQVNKGRYIEVVLAKVKTDEGYWPTLTSDKKKHHWLKVDFNRWLDEDEEGDHMHGYNDEFDDMSDMFSSKMGDFGDDNEKEDSSSAEEEDLPDVE